MLNTTTIGPSISFRWAAFGVLELIELKKCAYVLRLLTIVG